MGPPPRARPARTGAGASDDVLPTSWLPPGRPTRQPPPASSHSCARAATLVLAGAGAALLLRVGASTLLPPHAAPLPSAARGWRGQTTGVDGVGAEAEGRAGGGASASFSARFHPSPLPPPLAWPASALTPGLAADPPLDPDLLALITGPTSEEDVVVVEAAALASLAPTRTPPTPFLPTTATTPAAPATPTHPAVADLVGLALGATTTPSKGGGGGGGAMAASSSSTPPPPPALPPPPPHTLPPDFDWRTYLLYHPDLVARGITTAAAAGRHYLAAGRSEGRPAKRLRVLLRYSVCGGLINQHYAHITALTLAASLGADVVLPPSVKRDSFGSYFSTFRDRNEVVWAAAPLESLLDVEGLVSGWAARGRTLLRPPALSPFPDMTAPEVAFPAYAQPAVDAADPRLLTRVGGVYLAAAELEALVDQVRAAVMGAAGRVLRADPAAPIPGVTVDLPCTFFALRTQGRHLGAVSDVARTLDFAPAMVALADRVVEGMAAATRARAAAASPSPTTRALSSNSTTTPFRFNGVHLRIESDARDWSSIMGGADAVWEGYTGAMRAAKFESGSPLYAASGLLTYGAAGKMEDAIRTLVEDGLASSVHYKELYLPASETAGLSSEQSALVDFLVLSRASSFVGFGSSTFSFYLREHRALVGGLPRSSSILVDASAIGTDALFNAAGRVV